MTCVICKPDSAFEDEQEVCMDAGMLKKFSLGIYNDDIQSKVVLIVADA